MPPRSTRRRALQAAGAALVAGLAGCELRRRPPTTTATSTATEQPTDAETEAPDAGGTETTTRTPTATPTVGPGRTYTMVVTNATSTRQLEQMHGVPTDQQATVTLDVEETRRGEETTLFERSIDIGPGETRRFEDAFSTKTNGPSYVVRAKVEKYRKTERSMSRNRSDARRFEEGGFQSPPGTTFEVMVSAYELASTMLPRLGMDVPEDGGQ